MYGHYDVQPVDPLNEWHSGPFEPSIRGDYIYARGASDMKGQGHAFLKALEALLQNGELGVNVKVFFEGEEEIGSPSLPVFIAEHKELLKSDVVLNCDSGIMGINQPSMVYGLRGWSMACAALRTSSSGFTPPRRTCTRAPSAARSTTRPRPWPT